MSMDGLMVSAALRDIVVDRLGDLGYSPEEMSRVANYLQGTCNSPFSVGKRVEHLSGKIDARLAGTAIRVLADAGALVETSKGYILNPRLTVKENKKSKVPVSASSFSVLPEGLSETSQVRVGDVRRARDGVAELAIDHLDDWLASSDASRARLSPRTQRELSYEIWGDEKAMERFFGKRHAVKVEYTPVFSPDFLDREGGSVLFIENLDPYLTLCDALSQTRSAHVLGTPLAAVIFRGAPGFAAPAKLCDWLSRTTLAGRPVLYWGDIDRAGFQELARFMRHDGMDVVPFVPLYAKMLSRQARWFRRGVPPTPAKPGQGFDASAVRVLDLFPRHLRSKIVPILGQGCRIPQEILTLTDYMTCIGWAPAIRWLLTGPVPTGRK